MPPRVAQGADEAGPSGTAAEKSPALRFAFLQVLMQRGYLLDADAKALYRRLCSVDSGKAALSLASLGELSTLPCQGSVGATHMKSGAPACRRPLL